MELNYGYIRVSHKDQNLARQIDAFSSLELDKTFTDKQSGKDFDRPKYKELMKVLKEKDVVFVKSIDRLGRNYDEIIRQWNRITKEIKADIVVLDMPLLDTRSKGVDLISTFISDLVLQILSYVAQVERENTKVRQREGIASAKSRGVRMGRKFKPLPDNYINVLQRWEQKELSEVKAARALGIATATFRSWRSRPLETLLKEREGWTVKT